VALAPDDVFVAGYRGQIMHYDGTTWQQMRTPAVTRLTAMAASPSGEDLWVVGSLGSILHLDRR
jgi:hypothetical protein